MLLTFTVMNEWWPVWDVVMKHKNLLLLVLTKLIL